MAQDYMLNCCHDKDIPTAGDSRLTFGDRDFDLTDCEEECKGLGESMELPILAVLYEYYDRLRSPGNNIYAQRTMWRYGIENAPMNFSEFVQKGFGSSAWTLGATLEKYGMAPTRLQTSGTTFKWSEPKRAENNKYFVVFYTDNWHEISRSPIITERSYSLSSSDWNNIVQTVRAYDSNYFRWTVFTYHTKTFETGPYPSELQIYYV